MNFLIFIRNIAELCLFFGLALAFPRAFTGDVVPLAAAPVFSFALLLSNILNDKGHERLRFFVLLIPAAYAFFVCDSVDDVILLAPAMVYVLLNVIKNDPYIEYYDFLPLYKRLMIIVTVLFIFMLITEDALNRTALANFVSARPLGMYGAIYAILGIGLLKRLRLGNDFENTSLIIQLREMAIPLVISGLAALAFFGAKPLAVILKTGLLMLLTPFVALLSFMGNRSLEELQKYVEMRQKGDNSPPVEYHGFAPETTATPIPAQSSPETNSAFFAALMLILLIGLMVLLVLSVKRKKPTLKRVYSIEKLEEEEKKSRFTLRLSNREKVRRAYKKYLEKTQNRGVKTNNHMTSLEIRRAADRVTADRAAADGLRDIYIRARYDENAEITSEEARLAGEYARKAY